MTVGTSLIAVGDCNTLGTGELVRKSYPERVGCHLNASVTNCGFSMATSREGWRILRDHLCPEHSLVLIQFGLADAYLTCRFLPYILYYPDNPLRRTCRHLVKQLKKFTRRRGLNRILGDEHVVPLTEYSRNIERMVQACGSRKVLLLETIPHHDTWRNPHIERYNTELAGIAAGHSHCRLVQTYSTFAANLDRWYGDATHANALGHQIIADKIIELLAVSW